MRIKSVKIKNFRTLENIEFSIFDVKNCLVLFGKNNTGKSNIFHALDVFFSNSADKAPIESFKNPTNEIEIIIRFSDLSVEERVLHENNAIGGDIIIRQIIRPPTSGRGGGRRINYSAARSSGAEEIDQNEYPIIFEGVNHAAFWVDNPFGASNVFEGYLPRFFYLPAIDNIGDHLSLKKNQRVGELIADIIDRIAGTDPSITQIKNGLAALNSIQAINDFNNKVSNYLSELFPNSQFKLAIGEPDFLKVLELAHSFTSTDHAETHPALKGEGMQRAIIFAILREYSELIRSRLVASTTVRSLVFAIEEPELFMHPQMQESFKTILSQICANTDQVLFSTHSAYLIDIQNRRNYLRVAKKDDGCTEILQLSDIYINYQSVFNGDPSKEEFDLELLINPSVSRMFFADNVLLVEGEDDESLLTPLIQREKASSQGQKITSLIRAGGKGNLATLCVLLNEYAIPYLVIYDQDGNSNSGQKIEQVKAQKSVGDTYSAAPCLDEEIKNHLPNSQSNLTNYFRQESKSYNGQQVRIWKFSGKFAAYKVGSAITISDLPTNLQTKLRALI